MSDDGDEQINEDDAAEPKAVDKKKRRIKRDDKEAREFWRKIFADPIGRREMWGILAQAHVFEERFACGPNGFPQAEATWFHAGEQALGQRLLQSWQIMSFVGVHLMLRENDPRFAAADQPPGEDLDKLTEGL